jgi:hypothetical protein
VLENNDEELGIPGSRNIEICENSCKIIMKLNGK